MGNQSHTESVEVKLVSPMFVGEEYLDIGTVLRVPPEMAETCTAMVLKDELERPQVRDLTAPVAAAKPEIVSRVEKVPTKQPEPVSLANSGKVPKLTGHGTGKPSEATLAECIEATKGIDMAALPADSLTPKGYIKKAVLETLVKKSVAMDVFLDFMKQPLD